jgi:hypothetical protein
LELSIQDNKQNVLDIYNGIVCIPLAAVLHTNYTLRGTYYLSFGSEGKQQHSALMLLSIVPFPIYILEDEMQYKEEVLELALRIQLRVLKRADKIHFHSLKKHLSIPK